VDDVSFFHIGLLPMDEADDSQSDSVQLNKSSEIIDHSAVDKIDGLFSIKGVKYTTAPVIAKSMVAILRKKDAVNDRNQGSYVSSSPLNLDYAPAIKSLGDEYQKVTDHLKSRYGTDWRGVFKHLVDISEISEKGANWLSLKPPLLEAELKYFIADEMACTLLDVVVRRSNVGSAEQPSNEVLEKIADIMAGHLEWTDEEKSRQLACVEQFYTPIAGG
jgi:glycerol-3-phosphate dehydrogenase